jgi:hypothetical protein
MNPALIVLNPREIPECVEAIEALDIPKCWLSYMTEPHAAARANEMIAQNEFDAYVVLSDDTIPTQAALDLVLEAHEYAPVVTGYCNLDQSAWRETVNLTSNPLPPPPPEPQFYAFHGKEWVESHKTFWTTFAGLALTAMSRDMWMRFPLQTTAYGGQMDYDLSYRLQQAGIPITVAVGAYIEHVKERWNHQDENPQKRLLIGERRPEVRWSGVQDKASEYVA